MVEGVRGLRGRVSGAVGIDLFPDDPGSRKDCFEVDSVILTLRPFSFYRRTRAASL